ncbi:major facilitator superfamily domain-containing protein [Cadophora sp. MPI-SDFR-AT-0126]|nr:major facilitator superfamily domain-containing protein [Leotiomycetes sp. MPI-SDFR-AT-0126]
MKSSGQGRASVSLSSDREGIESPGFSQDAEVAALYATVHLEKKELASQNDDFMVTWNGPNDPELPVNWSSWKIWTNILLIPTFTLLTPFASSMFAPSVGNVLTEFGSTNLDLGSFSVSVYLLGYAFGPLIIAPLSEMYGRLPFVLDLVPQEQRGRVMAIWTLLVLLGPSIGPVREARRLQIVTGDLRWSPTGESNEAPKKIFWQSIARPTQMLFLSPVILGPSILTETVYGILYLLFTAITDMFAQDYNMRQNVGFVYFGFGLGQFLGLLLFRGKMVPEYRLPPPGPGAALVPIGLLIYGWAAEYRVHWIVPVFSTVIIGFGVIIIFTTVGTYLVDAFSTYVASATAANTVFRSLGGALLPLCGQKMYATIGNGWGNTLLAGLSSAMLPMIWAIMKYGHAMRAKSRF